MRVCVAGAGAIGGFMGGRLAEAGHDVTLVTLGEHLEAIRTEGLRIVGTEGAERVVTNVDATDDFSLVGRQDVVILGVKAYQIEGVAPLLPPLFDPHTVLVTVQNGIPWWYFQRHGGSLDGRRIECLDPLGVIEHHLPASRIIGCVAYPAVEQVAPGLLRHVEGFRFPVGELDSATTPRVQSLSELLVSAGFKSPILPDIRAEIWLKAIGSLAFNPLSALTHAYLADICRAPETRSLALEMMREGERVAGQLGVTLRLPPERRLAGAEQIAGHKTSMLQDVEAGRALEIDALMKAVLELAVLTGTPTPNVSAVYACVKLLDQTFREGRSRLRAERAAVVDLFA
ncbi:MAG TPA: 2-dehydropantoate 2-reductase [Gemmatimonadales bacterium]|nr:2-dehydropantoate 2-reductase [Gemmatimonadales bacterium]